MAKTNLPAMLLTMTVASALPCASADDVSAECRGVAAGIVASMRAAGEIPNEGAVESAVVAARRGCTAAVEQLGGKVSNQGVTTDAATAAPAIAESEEKSESSLWETLTGKRERKPGNDRLRRLKTQ